MASRCGDPLPEPALPLLVAAYERTHGRVHQFYDAGQQWCSVPTLYRLLRDQRCESRKQWDWSHSRASA